MKIEQLFFGATFPAQDDLLLYGILKENKHAFNKRWQIYSNNNRSET